MEHDTIVWCERTFLLFLFILHCSSGQVQPVLFYFDCFLYSTPIFPGRRAALARPTSSFGFSSSNGSWIHWVWSMSKQDLTESQDLREITCSFGALQCKCLSCLDQARTLRTPHHLPWSFPRDACDGGSDHGWPQQNNGPSDPSAVSSRVLSEHFFVFWWGFHHLSSV